MDAKKFCPLRNRTIFGKLLMKMELLLIWRFVSSDAFPSPISVFDKGIITRHLKNGANLHQTAAIG